VRATEKMRRYLLRIAEWFGDSAERARFGDILG
jgi:hypothetical protein